MILVFYIKNSKILLFLQHTPCIDPRRCVLCTPGIKRINLWRVEPGILVKPLSMPLRETRGRFCKGYLRHQSTILRKTSSAGITALRGKPCLCHVCVLKLLQRSLLTAALGCIKIRCMSNIYQFKIYYCDGLDSLGDSRHARGVA